MTTENHIPSQLFLRASLKVEEALRRDTAEAISHFKRDGDYIATWEDGRVVLLHGSHASNVELPQPEVAIQPLPGRVVTRFEPLLLDLVLRLAQKTYVRDGELYVEFPHGEKDLGEFLSRPENEDILSDLSRELTGREMPAHLSYVAEPKYHKPPGFDSNTWVILQLRAIIEMLRAGGGSPLVPQFEELLSRRQFFKEPGPRPVISGELRKIPLRPPVVRRGASNPPTRKPKE